MGAPDEEYECLIPKLYSRLSSPDDEATLVSWLESEVQGHFGIVPKASHEFIHSVITWYSSHRNTGDSRGNVWTIGRRIDVGNQNHSGWLPDGAAIPEPTPSSKICLWIEEHGDGCYLFFGIRGEANDSWHPTLIEAFSQAEFQFGVSPKEWRKGGGT